MMDEIKQDWLVQVENAVYKGRPHPSALSPAGCSHMDTPVSYISIIV